VGDRIGIITLIDENLVRVTIPGSVRMGEVVYVAGERLMGEVIRVRPGLADIQVYEDTTMIRTGEKVEFTGDVLQVELGPGLLTGIFDGLGNPLKKYDIFLTRGVHYPAVDPDKKWDFVPKLKKNDAVVAGDIIGTVQETPLVEHRILIPVDISGRILEIKEGKFSAYETVAVVKDKKGKKHKLSMVQRWPVRIPRPIKGRLKLSEMLETRTRVIDGFFPIAKGGTGCFPGAFGTGKTVAEHQLSRQSQAQIVIYVGCGERAGEMVELITEFPELTDPDTGRPLIERTIMVVNTSAMPVAARESSVYLGVTFGEYFRDQGYDVLVLADSTSRWLQALREMSGRLEEIPGEEGFPAYLETRISSWYERAGKARCLGSGDRVGSVTVIGAVSPPGGDFSEPVTQATVKVTGCFFGLSRRLAEARIYPAIDPIISKSKYFEDLTPFFSENGYPGWADGIELLKNYISEGTRIKEQIDILGDAGVSDRDYLKYQLSLMIRDAYLVQDFFHKVDQATDLDRHYFMLEFIREIIDWAKKLESVGKEKMRERLNKITYEMIQMNYQEDYKKYGEKIKKELLKE
jgi:V/A-type H+-transporting ATPase subunit A